MRDHDVSKLSDQGLKQLCDHNAMYDTIYEHLYEYTTKLLFQFTCLNTHLRRHLFIPTTKNEMERIISVMSVIRSRASESLPRIAFRENSEGSIGIAGFTELSSLHKMRKLSAIIIAFSNCPIEGNPPERLSPIDHLSWIIRISMFMHHHSLSVGSSSPHTFFPIAAEPPRFLKKTRNGRANPRTSS